MTFKSFNDKINYYVTYLENSEGRTFGFYGGEKIASVFWNFYPRNHFLVLANGANFLFLFLHGFCPQIPRGSLRLMLSPYSRFHQILQFLFK